MTGAFFLIAYVCAIIGAALYLLTLASRFVKAHERVAGALEKLVHSQRGREG